MKNRVMVAIYFILCLSLFISLPVLAETPEQELAQILNRSIEIMGKMVQDNLVVQHMELDVIPVDSSYVMTQEMVPGYLYTIVGIGGTGISDLDVLIYGENDDLVASDTAVDNIPVVVGSTNVNGTYYIKVTAESLEDGYTWQEPYYFALVIGTRPE